MNLAKQFREFGVRNSINPMSRDVQTLYYNLLQLFNMAFWQPRLQVETKTLEHICDMSRKQIDIARNTLIQKGFITYHKKAGSASPDYEITKLYDEVVFLGETQMGTQTGSQLGGQTVHKGNTNDSPPYRDKTIKTKLNKSLFRDSEFFDFEKFSSALPEWTAEQCEHYYNSALDWSNGNGEKKLDWISTVKSWDRKEPFKERIKKAPHTGGAAPKAPYSRQDTIETAKNVINDLNNGRSIIQID